MVEQDLEQGGQEFPEMPEQDCHQETEPRSYGLFKDIDTGWEEFEEASW